MGKRTLSNRELKHGTQRTLALIDGLARIIGSLAKWGTIAWIAYCLYLSVNSLSGKETISNIAVKVFGNLSINQWLAYVFAGGGCVWGISERSFRRKKTAELGNRVKELETIIDKNRSSSNLPQTGQTHPEDEI
jgi:hypothetical protein